VLIVVAEFKINPAELLIFILQDCPEGKLTGNDPVQF